MLQAFKIASYFSGAALFLCVASCSPAQNIQPEPELALEGESKEAFDAVFGDTETRPDSYTIIATDSGWQFENWQRDEAYEQPLSDTDGGANACTAPDTPRVSLPENTTVELVFKTYQTAETFTERFRRTCINEWDIDVEYLPGYPIGHNVNTGEARSICAVCDNQRDGTKATPLLIEIGPSPQ